MVRSRQDKDGDGVGAKLFLQGVPHGDGLALVSQHLVPVIQFVARAAGTEDATPQDVPVTYEVMVKDADFQGHFGQNLGRDVEGQSLVPHGVDGAATHGGLLPLDLLALHHQGHAHERILK